MSEPFVGEITMFAGNFAPRGWAFCDGQLLSISQNDALFSLLGTIYGGDGRTTFGLPEMRGRVPIHAGSGPGLTPQALGHKAGIERNTITANTMPSHSHAFNGTSDGAGDGNPLGNVPATVTGSVYNTGGVMPVALNSSMFTNTGGSQSYSNLMPTLCVHFIIALFGIFPSRS